MTWYAWLFIIWIAYDRFAAGLFALERRSITFTPRLWVWLMISAALQVWAIVSLAT